MDWKICCNSRVQILSMVMRAHACGERVARSGRMVLRSDEASDRAGTNQDRRYSSNSDTRRMAGEMVGLGDEQALGRRTGMAKGCRESD
ncbi:UNVERIFIED_CONTAM: hypothetical protein Sangu_1673700 [Sesamum angustifolium]|uniref:Uncharacterized protein n=1 Tax=Sesamum angustifolium TaxID=2727405 RepID=A0AAW2MIZ7_9LAMI